MANPEHLAILKQGSRGECVQVVSLGLTPSRNCAAPEGARVLISGAYNERSQRSASLHAGLSIVPPSPHAARKTGARRKRGSGLGRGRKQPSEFSQL
jgi:hypothetical protein